MSEQNHLFPNFEKTSLAGQYQQISNYCIDHLEGWLVSLMHMEVPENLERPAESYVPLLEAMQKRERTIRHSFQFQIEKHFNDFKSIRRTRLRANRSSDFLVLGFVGQSASSVQQLVEQISEKYQKLHETRILNQNLRLKALVHRFDDDLHDDPLCPLSLTNAFLASIETLNLTALKTRQLLELFETVMEAQIDKLYKQIDLGMYYLDLLPELTKPELYSDPAGALADPIPEPEEEPEEIEQARLLLIHQVLKSGRSEHRKNAEKQIHEIFSQYRRWSRHGTADIDRLFSRLETHLAPFLADRKYVDLVEFNQYFAHLYHSPKLGDKFRDLLIRFSGPFQRIALNDPFLNRSSKHPIQHFLQDLIEFGSEHDIDSEPLDKLTEGLKRLNHKTETTVTDFFPLIDQFESSKKRYFEQLQIEKEREIEKQQRQKREILEFINQITGRLVLENETLAFFYDDWQLLLNQIAEKLGSNSIEFEQALDIARLLSWSFDDNREDNQQYSRYSFTSVLKAIDKGLASLNYSSEHRNRTRKNLLAEFKTHNKEKPSGFTVITGPQSGRSVSTQFNGFFGGVSPFTSFSHHAQPKPNVNITATLSDKIQLGAWVEILNLGERHFRRARLKWKSTDNNQFIFIDQRGHKLKECDRITLDIEYSQENIRLLNNPSSFGKNITQLGDGFKVYN